MQTILEWFKNSVEFDLQVRVFITIIIVILVTILRQILARIIDESVKDIHVRYRWRRTLAYVSIGLSIVLIGALWLDGLGALSTVLGLTAAGLVVVLRDPLLDLAGWMLIVFQHPLNQGDRIEIDDVKGDVIDIGLFQFTVLEIGNWVDADQSTGRVIHVPNKQVFLRPLANYTGDFPYIWNEVTLIVTFESDWQATHQLLETIVKRETQAIVDAARSYKARSGGRYPIVYSTMTPKVYMDVKENGVQFALRYLCEPRTRRSSEQQLWQAILTAFNEDPSIQFAYPTRRFYSRWIEHTPGEEEETRAMTPPLLDEERD